MSAVGPVAKQLKSMGYSTEEFRKGLDSVSSMEPALVVAYAEPTKITASTQGDFLEMKLGMLAGFDKGGSGLSGLLRGLSKGPRIN